MHFLEVSSSATARHRRGEPAGCGQHTAHSHLSPLSSDAYTQLRTGLGADTEYNPGKYNTEEKTPISKNPATEEVKEKLLAGFLSISKASWVIVETRCPTPTFKW